MNLVKNKVIPLLLLLSPMSIAKGACNFDYHAELRIAYSKGSFEVENNGFSDDFGKTHNNASRAGGNLLYKCGDTTIKYNYHSSIDLIDNQLEATEIINMISLSNERFGVISVGKFSTPYKVAGQMGDPFWDTAAGTTAAANNFGFSELTRGFTDRSVMYTTPGIHNFYLNIGYSGHHSDGDIHSGLEYKNSGGALGIQYVNLSENPYVANGKSSKDAVRLYGRKILNEWMVSASIEDIDRKPDSTSNFYNLSMEKKFSDVGRLAMSYGKISEVKLLLINGSPYEGSGFGWSAGGFYNWAKHSELYLLASRLDFKDSNKQNSIILGANYLFSI